MIPKIIHYCWLGDSEFPELVKKCIQSWKKKMPDREFILWDKNCLKDLNSDWVNEAYSTKKYAFAADYIRLYAVNKFGGFYLDSDVEVLKNFAPLLDSPYIFALENEIGDIEAATFGSEPNNPYVQKCLSYYEGRHFIKKDNTYDTFPLPKILKAQLKGAEYINSYTEIKADHINPQILPIDYFSPKDSGSGKLTNLTKNTFSIHHFNGSWFSFQERTFRFISRWFGFRFAKMISNTYKKCFSYASVLFSIGIHSFSSDM